MEKDWIDAVEACGRLGVRAQTLYAYVSRGLLEARPDPGDPRRRIYRAADVDGMAARKRAGRSRPAVAARTIDWGDPVLETQIATVDHGRLIYRGRDAAAWSETATLEETAALLAMVEPWPRRHAEGRSIQQGGLTGAMRALADAMAGAQPMFGRSRNVLVEEAAGLLSGLGAAMLGTPVTSSLHEAVAGAWGLRPRTADLVRRAMVLCADHELNASTFAVRVTASTGASLPAALLSGLAALSGPVHGGATLRTMAMFREALGAADPAGYFSARLSRGEPVWGLGHPLYPDGDVRAKEILRNLRLAPSLRAVIEAAQAAGGQALNLDGGLAALAHAEGLGEGEAFSIFALGRSAGWIAHALEQVETGALIRPRARYTGSLGQR
jgi:citrate synthase